MNASNFQLFNPNIYNTCIVKDTLFHLNSIDSKIQQLNLITGKLIREYEVDVSQYRLAEYSETYGLILQQNLSSGKVALLSLDNYKILKEITPASIRTKVEKIGLKVFSSLKGEYVEFYDYKNFNLIAKLRYKNDLFQDGKFETDQTFYFADRQYNYRYNPRSNSIEILKQINSTRNIFLEDIDDNTWNSSEGGVQLFPKKNFIDYSQRELTDAWFFQPYGNEYIYGNYTEGLKHVKLNPYEVNPIVSDKKNNTYYKPSLMKDKLYIPGSAYISVIDGDELRHLDVREFNTELITSFYDEQTKSVYFGGLKSLLKLSENESMEFYEDKEEVFQKHVLSIERFDEENLIVGTRTELCLFNTKTMKYTSLEEIYDNKEIVGAISMEKDNRGNIWIGNRIGICLLKVKERSIAKVGKNVPEDDVNSILQIKDNVLVFCSSKDLLFFELNEFYKSGRIKVSAFTHKNGYRGEEVSLGAIVLKDSILWLPTATNLVSININNVSFEPSFTNITINSINKSSLNLNFGSNKMMELPFGTNDLVIDYEAIGVNQPPVRMFQYKLIGYDDEWGRWTTDQSAHFRDLSSGDYKFVVRSMNNSVGKGLPEKSVKIRLDMPFYSEPNFHENALYLALFLFSLIGLLLYNLFKRQKVKNELDKQFKLLQIQTLQLQLNPHFLFNVLGTIQSLILEKDVENANKYLVSFSKMIRRYLEYNVSAYKSLEANNSDAINISLREELDILKIYLDFEKLQLEDKFDYEITIDEAIDPNESMIPPLIIQPLIENCIKHGVVPKEGKSFIQLNALKKGNGIVIYIKDDGIGISGSAEIKDEGTKEFKSLGLQLINERISVLNSMGASISLEINDLPNQGGVEQIIFMDQIQNEE